MPDARFTDCSTKPPPKCGLPAPFVFKPPVVGYHRRLVVDASVRAVLDWCTEQFGEGRELNMPFDFADKLDGAPWGWWPTGTIFIADEAEAMWFRFRWT